MNLIEFDDFVICNEEYKPVIIPRASQDHGYFTINTSNSTFKELSIAVLGYSLEVMDILPYYSNTEFGIVSVVPFSENFTSLYGGQASEICNLRLVGKSKDSFGKKYGSFLRESVLATRLKTSSPKEFLPLALTMSMQPEINSQGNRYFSVNFEVVNIPKDLKIDWGYMANLPAVKALPAN